MDLKAVSLVALSALCMHAQADTLLAPAKTLAGVNTRGVAVADLFGDGGKELVACNFGSSAAIGQASAVDGSVQIFRQTAQGLVLGQTLVPGKAPREAAAVDLNGDGLLDLVVSLYGEDAVAVYLQRSDHQFTLVGKSATGSQPVGVAVLAGDKPTVAVVNHGTGTLSLFKGLGDSGLLFLSTLASAPAGQASSPTAAAFISLGGAQKLVAADFGANALGLIDIATGEVQSIPLPAGSLPCKVAVGDLNKDGRQDLAVALFGDDSKPVAQVALFFAQANGLGQPVLVNLAGKHPNGIALGDVLGNGKLAVVAADRDSDLVDVVTEEAGVWALKASLSVAEDAGTTREAFQGPVGLAVADLNGDGFADIVTGYNRSAGSVKVLLHSLPTAPLVASASHPDQAKWYPASTADLSWPAVADLSGIKAYRFSLDEDPLGQPGRDSKSITGTQISFPGLSTGVHYFHVQAEDVNGHLGAISHYTLRVTGEMSKESVYNWPNPSRDGRTSIRFPLPVARPVSISIYDELGGQVWNKELGIADTVAGVNQVLWEGVNARGGKVANGGYILKVVSGGITVTKKIAIIR